MRLHEVKVSNVLDIIHKRNFGKRFFFFIIGTLISAFAFNIFFSPYEVIPTGSSGLAFLLVQYVNIDISIMVLIINLFLFLIGLIFYKEIYALKFLIITLIYPVFLSFTSLFVDYFDFGNTSLFLIMMFAGGLMGFSSGLIRKSDFNSGGFNVIFDLIYDKFKISIGTSSFVINSVLIIISGFIFGLDKALYAIVAMLVSSYIVDRVIIGISNNKVFYIITSRPSEIRDLIIDKYHYSVTIVKSHGGYDMKKKKMLMCVLPTIEYFSLKEAIKALDPNVFFLIADVYESSVKKNCKNM